MKVILSGYGKMGHMVEQELQRRGIECLPTNNIESIPASQARDAVCIDFSTPSAFMANYSLLATRFQAVVVGTTGWDHMRQDVADAFAVAGTTLVHSSNFSVGVNVLMAAVELVAQRLSSAGGYASYIIEKHHHHKLDAPSGTAKQLSRIVGKYIEPEPNVASVRVGELAGTHLVGFEGMGDRIILEHEAFSRRGFAAGAVIAAIMTQKLPVGCYDFHDLLTKSL